METRVIVIKDPVKDCMYCWAQNVPNIPLLTSMVTEESAYMQHYVEEAKSRGEEKPLLCHHDPTKQPVPCNDKNCPLKKLSFYRRTKKYEKVIPLEKCPICGKRPVKYLTVTYNQSKKKNVDTYIYECYGKKLNAEEPHFEGEDKVTDRTARLAWNRLVKSYISSHKKHKN
jgi:hypothetical protein